MTHLKESTVNPTKAGLYLEYFGFGYWVFKCGDLLSLC